MSLMRTSPNEISIITPSRLIFNRVLGEKHPPPLPLPPPLLPPHVPQAPPADVQFTVFEQVPGVQVLVCSNWHVEQWPAPPLPQSVGATGGEGVQAPQLQEAHLLVLGSQ